MLAAACVMIPTVWLPNVKTLSYLGFAGVAGTLSVAATVGLHLLPSQQTI
jgi:solute carrier family 32 (vesicular inhibitory amino acid transporter)